MVGFVVSCFRGFVMVMLLNVAAARLAGQAFQPPLASQSFTVDGVSEIVATLHASCEGCDWGVAGREGAAVTIAVDGRYRQHVMLTRGEAESEYRVLLGRFTRGAHTITVAADSSATAAGVKTVHVS